MDSRDARLALAQRLRALREEHWPGMIITQRQVADALSKNKKVSVPSISSWESQVSPQVLPQHRLEDYAALFGAGRPASPQELRVLSAREMTDEQLRATEQLEQELTGLRHEAQRATRVGEATQSAGPLGAGPWTFPDGKPITIVCAELPDDEIQHMRQTSRGDSDSPHFEALRTYCDLDAVFELYGHLRGSNPGSQVNLRAARRLTADDYTSHLISLGGVDWNTATSSVLDRLQLPVTQVAEWDQSDGVFFEVTEGDAKTPHRPSVVASGKKVILREDVALFARAVNPFNRRRTVTICNGMYAAGTVGAVRALTDANFRERNTEFIAEQFAECEAFCLLFQVTVEQGNALTPDWTLPDTRLFEWSRTEG